MVRYNDLGHFDLLRVLATFLFPLLYYFVLQTKLLLNIELVLLKPGVEIVVFGEELSALGKEDQMGVLELLLFALLNFFKGLSHFNFLHLEHLILLYQLVSLLFVVSDQVLIRHEFGLLLIDHELQRF